MALEFDAYFVNSNKTFNAAFDTGSAAPIQHVQENGVELPIVDKTVNVIVPTAVSELANDAGYVTADEVEDTLIGMLSFAEEDTAPYVLRASHAGVRAVDEIVGGTVAWNQLVTAYQATVYAGISRDMVGDSIADGLRIHGTAEVSANYSLVTSAPGYSNNGHQYLWTLGNVTLPAGARINYAVNGQDQATATIYPITYIQGFGLYITSGTVIDVVVYPQITDLTAMFGSTIADYAYSLEQSTAGSGIAWLQSYGFFTEDYYPYHEASLESVQTSARVVRDENDTVVATYPLSPIPLRGIPKLVDGEIVYDGDTYQSDGTVTRYWGTLTLNGSESWTWDSNNSLAHTIVSGLIVTGAQTQYDVVTFNSNSALADSSWAGRTVDAPCIGPYYGQPRLYVKSSAITSANDAKTYFTSNPTELIYLLNSPTTETADPYTNPQAVISGGTEAYTDYAYEQGDRDFAMPTGHDTEYDIPILEAPSTDGTYTLTATVSGGKASFEWAAATRNASKSVVEETKKVVEEPTVEEDER